MPEQRLTDTEALLKKLSKMIDYCKKNEKVNGLTALFQVGDAIMDCTTDVDPVVRCKDCKHWQPTGSKAGNSFSDMEYIGGCEFTKYCRRESDFCSYGKRKEGAE